MKTCGIKYPWFISYLLEALIPRNTYACAHWRNATLVVNTFPLHFHEVQPWSEMLWQFWTQMIQNMIKY